MSEANVGLRKFLYTPWVYSAFQWAVGAKRWRNFFINEFIKPAPGLRILDIGCGTGEIAEFFPESEYVGFDANPGYIELARKYRKGNCTFHCSRVSEADVDPLGKFDIVLAMSVIHHLDDDEAQRLFKIASLVLKPGGSLYTSDTSFSDDQSPLRKWMVSQDRGQNVRFPKEYETLAKMYFSDVSSIVRHDLLVLPYTFCLLKCNP